MPRPEGKEVSARHTERMCIVVACEDAAEAAQVGEQILKLNTGSMMTYRSAEDVLLHAPAGRVVLIVLAAGDDPEAMGKNLAWMRRRWPHCPIAVIGDEGGGQTEILARKAGASYLTRPVGSDQWAAMVAHVLHVRGRPASRTRLG